MVLFIDNYDSFSHILTDYLKQVGLECRVVRNDETDIEGLLKMDTGALVISPGPGRPENSGMVNQAIEAFHTKVPILGICLGHQALGCFFGGHLLKSEWPVHGKTEKVRHFGHPVFEGVPEQFDAMRYHSLIIDNLQNGPVEIIAESSNGLTMALAHKTLPITGLQFHPESVLTEHGLQIIRNWKRLNNL